MASNVGWLNAPSGNEAAQGGSWKDRLIESLNKDYHEHPQEASVSHEESYVHNVFSSGDHLLEEDDEVIEHLMQREASLLLCKQYAESYSGNDNTDLQESRERAVYWMLTVQAFHGFTPCTAFLAVNYFDRFLANQRENLLHESRSVPWLLQLLAVGCMSLAAKVEEPEVPLLLDLQVGDVPHVFEARTIQRMELLILNTLQWRLSSATPFSFLGYLWQKMRMCGRSLCSSLVLPLVEEFILNSCRDHRLLVYSPSVLAMASLICACKELLCDQEASSCKHALLCLWPNRKELTVECAGLMQEFVVGAHPFLWNSVCKLVAPPPHPNSAPESPNGVLDAACFSCESGSTTCSSLISTCKRRVLSFSGSGQAHAAEWTNSRSAIAKAAAFSRSSSPSVCRTIVDSCSRKRKMKERTNTNSCSTAICAMRTASDQEGEPAPIERPIN